MQINLFKCSWFCLSPLQRPLVSKGGWGEGKMKARGVLGHQAGGSVCEGDSGRFPIYSTKTFENLETAANGTDIFRKSSRKFWILLNFQNANHSTKNSRNSGNKVGSESTPREVVLFFGNFAKCCSIPH